MFLIYTVIDEKQARQTVGMVTQSSFSLSLYCPAIISSSLSIDLKRGGLALCQSHLFLGERINNPRKGRGREKKSPED